MPSARHPGDAAWLAQLCISRTGFALIFTAYAGALPLLVSEWSMSASQAGLIQSCWHLGYLVSLFTVGFLADHYGAKRVFLASGVAASASALLFALFSDGFISGALLYGLTGLFSGGSYTPGLTLISERFDPSKRGRAMGFFLAAASLGYALALVITGALTPHIGWRGAFLVNACGPVAGALLAFYALRASENLIHPLPAGQSAAAPLPAVLKNKPAMLAIGAYAFHSWELLGMKAWMPAFFAAAAQLAGRSITEAVSLGAMLTAVAYGGSMAGSIAGGAISDRMGRTWTMLLMSFASLACSILFGWMIELPLWLLVAMGAFYSFVAIGDSSVYSTAITELVPRRYIGAAYSVRSVLGFGAGAFSPWIFGLVLDWTRAAESSALWMWGLAFSSIAAGALLVPLAAWRLRLMPEAEQMAGGKR